MPSLAFFRPTRRYIAQTVRDNLRAHNGHGYEKYSSDAGLYPLQSSPKLFGVGRYDANPCLSMASEWPRCRQRDYENLSTGYGKPSIRAGGVENFR